MLTDQINSDLKDAMKAQDAGTLSTLRMLKSALKNKQIDLMHELTDEEAMAVVKTQLKQLKEAQEINAEAGREEGVQAAAAEMVVLQKYLPAQMDDMTLTQIVTDAVRASGATAKADQGKAMGAAMKAVAGKADGGRVKAIVESLLAVFVVLISLAAVSQPAFAATSVASQNTEFVVTGARILRVFLMLMGLVSVNFIILGAVSVMTASGRDHGHHHGLQQIAIGIFGTILMAGLIVIASATIDKLG